MPHRTIAVLILVFGTSNSGAQGRPLPQPDRAALKASCSGDYATFCGDLAPDGPEIQKCFRKNMADLSPACRTEIGRHEKRGKKG
ncbi:hypothetical protein MFUR16E_22925 [Methylobacterium fujisawaense]|uniref:hypothetical protein n=1 Tax=Methylobacterium fujisawaense TaxID=107400 RepID=UPI002F32C2CF